MKNILKTGIVTTLSVVFFGITNQANADLVKECINLVGAQDYQRALQIGLEAVRTEPNSVGSYLCVGRSYLNLGRYNQAIKYLKIAEKYAVSKNALSALYNLEGVAYEASGDFNNALLYFNKALSLDIELRDRRGKLLNLNNIAGLYSNTGKLNKALELYKRILALYNKKDRGVIYNDIAEVYFNKGDYKKAIGYERKAIEIDQRLGNYYGLARDYLNFGSDYILAKDFSKAKYYLEQGLSMEKKIGNLRWQGTAYKYLGLLYFVERDKITAREYWKKALKYFSSAGDKTDALDVADALKKLDEK